MKETSVDPYTAVRYITFWYFLSGFHLQTKSGPYFKTSTKMEMHVQYLCQTLIQAHLCIDKFLLLMFCFFVLVEMCPLLWSTQDRTIVFVQKGTIIFIFVQYFVFPCIVPFFPPTLPCCHFQSPDFPQFPV